MISLWKFLKTVLCAMTLPALLGSTSAWAAPSEYEVKAQFIRQFATFVEWPASGAPLRLCILGRDPLGVALESLRGTSAKDRRLEIVFLDVKDDIHDCQMLYVAGSTERHLERVAALARGAGILILGDTEGYALRGAMINFYLDTGKVRFEINLEAIRQSTLKISSKLLALGRVADNRFDR